MSTPAVSPYSNVQQAGAEAAARALEAAQEAAQAGKRAAEERAQREAALTAEARSRGVEVDVLRFESSPDRSHPVTRRGRHPVDLLATRRQYKPARVRYV